MKDYDISLRGHHLRILRGFLFNNTENLIRDRATKDHNKLHADNIISVLKKIAELKVRIKIIDAPDNICESCGNKNSKMCNEFIPYDVSAAADDRGTAYFYKLKINKVYPAKHIFKKLKEIGPIY